MTWRAISIFLLVGSLSSSSVHAEPEAVNPFRQRYETGLMSTERPSPEVQAYARGQHYVFVAGIFADLIQPHFKNFISALEEIGVGADQIDRFFPPTADSIESDARDLARKLKAIVEKNPKRKLTLVGHSKGAAALLALALKDPHFIVDHVDSLILIQAAIGGSPLASGLMGKAEPDARSLPWLDRAVFRATRRIVHRFRFYFARGGISLFPAHAQRYFRRLMERNPEAAKLIGDRVFYLRTFRTPSKRFNLRRPSALYLQQEAGDNDDSVPLASQWLEGLGTDLGVLEATHTDLVTNTPFPSRSLSARGRALMYLFLEHVSSGKCSETFKELGEALDETSAAVPETKP